MEVCPGLRLNMSRWQLSELEQAIGRSMCMYVWVDKLALPQDESRLQRTLLSRSGCKRNLSLGAAHHPTPDVGRCRQSVQ